MYAIIPARAGSKRVPNKNIKLLGKHPLLAYSIEACKLSEAIERIFVSTDSNQIASVAMFYGAEIIERPASMATDNSIDIEYLGQFFSLYDVEEVALIRPTSPLRDPIILKRVIKLYNSLSKKFTGVRTMHEAAHPPQKMFQLEDDGLTCKAFSNSLIEESNLPSQSFKKAYLPNSYIDIVQRKHLDFGQKIYSVITEPLTDIDIQYDFDIAELQLYTKVDKISNSLSKYI